MLRTVRDDDLAALAALLRELHDFHAGLEPALFRRAAAWTAETAAAAREEAREAVEGSDCCYVWEDGEGLAGFVRAKRAEVRGDDALFERRMLVVHDLYVRAERRGRGIGRSLLAAAERRAAELGLDSVEIPVYTRNAAAAAFYAARGYAPYVTRIRKVL
jgi:GNAT superfamily N-acetyltransferase